MEKQAATITKAATELARFTNPGQAEQISKAVQAVEHEGDALMHSVEEALAKTFVTPIDREDIQKMASSLDDILDLLNEAARAMHLYGLDVPSEPMQQIVDLISKASERLTAAIADLRKAAYDDMLKAARDIKQLEKQGDTIFRAAVAQLFRDDTIGAKQLLRDKEILTDLEEALDACEDAAEYLSHLAVKNG